MAQINIFSTDKPNFIDACQSIPSDKSGYAEYTDDRSCKLADASEEAGELFNSNPLAFMPNIVENLKSISHGFVQNSLRMCIPWDKIQISYRWEEKDSEVVSKNLINASEDKAKAFAKYLNTSNNTSFGIMTVSALASSTKGGIIAASLLKKLKNPGLGVSILFGMENPARAARILNLWKYQDAEHGNTITLELNKIRSNDKNEKTRHRYFRLQTYEYGTSINADLFINPIDAVNISEKVLLGFDKYEEILKNSKADIWKTIAELSKAQSRLKEHTLSLATSGLIEPCRISYDQYYRIEEVECILIPPKLSHPLKEQQNDIISPATNDFIDDLRRMKNLIDDYEYCEALLDGITDVIMNARYQALESAKIHDTVDVIINLKDIIDEIEGAENELVGKGYAPPFPHGPEELRSLLEDIEHEFIEIENAAIDMETKRRSKYGE